MARIDASGTIAGLDLLAKRADAATRDIVADAAHIVQANVMAVTPVGVPGNTTNPPGDLRRSLDVEGPTGSDGTYVARMGPTKVYSRQRELGGHIYPGRARSIGSEGIGGTSPGKQYLVFTKFGVVYKSIHVYQHPRPYMLPGLKASGPQIDTMIEERMGAALVGS